jgi:hypothetical protein
MELIPEITNDPKFKFSIPEPELVTGNLVQLIDVSFGWSQDTLLYSAINLCVEPDSRIALVGKLRFQIHFKFLQR